jgi:hypothetical protein
MSVGRALVVYKPESLPTPTCAHLTKFCIEHYCDVGISRARQGPHWVVVCCGLQYEHHYICPARCGLQYEHHYIRPARSGWWNSPHSCSVGKSTTTTTGSFNNVYMVRMWSLGLWPTAECIGLQLLMRGYALLAVCMRRWKEALTALGFRVLVMIRVCVCVVIKYLAPHALDSGCGMCNSGQSPGVLSKVLQLIFAC